MEDNQTSFEELLHEIEQLMILVAVEDRSEDV